MKVSTDVQTKEIGILTVAACNLVEGEGSGKSEALGEPAVAGDEEMLRSSGKGLCAQQGGWVGGQVIAGPGACNGPLTVESFTLLRLLTTLNMTVWPRAGDGEKGLFCQADCHATSSKCNERRMRTHLVV